VPDRPVGGPATDDEQALVAGLRAGAPWARRAFCERAHDATYAWACRLTRDADLRRDWTHDALLRLMADVADGRFTWPCSCTRSAATRRSPRPSGARSTPCAPISAAAAWRCASAWCAGWGWTGEDAG